MRVTEQFPLHPVVIDPEATINLIDFLLCQCKHLQACPEAFTEEMRNKLAERCEQLSVAREHIQEEGLTEEITTEIKEKLLAHYQVIASMIFAELPTEVAQAILEAVKDISNVAGLAEDQQSFNDTYGGAVSSTLGMYIQAHFFGRDPLNTEARANLVAALDRIATKLAPVLSEVLNTAPTPLLERFGVGGDHPGGGESVLSGPGIGEI